MAHLTITCLGGFAATLDGQPITNFRSAKTRALLAYLAVEGGRAHQRDSLIDLLWSEQDLTKANANFRQSLSRLQRVIGNKKTDPPFMDVTRQTVIWNPASDHNLDVTDLRHAVDSFPAHPDPARLQAALDAYAGDFLAGFFVDDAPEFEDWAATVREEMHQTFFRGLSHLADYADARGDFAQAESLARRQLALIPWDESAHRRLMQALAMQGQRNQALAQYDRCFALLEEELGVEPSEETGALYEQIATGVVVAPEEKQDLPQPVTSFVGRTAEIGHMVRTLSHPDCRVLTLAGPGGAGKTRLALQVARQFMAQTGQEVVFVSLVGVHTLAQAQGVVGRALEIPLVDPAQITAQVRGALADRDLLMILDNAESLAADPASGFVGWLDTVRAGMDGVRLLVTSRQPLQAQAEWVLPVEGLAYPASTQKLWPDAWQQYDALVLFAQRARQAKISFAVTQGNLAEMVAICRTVEGAPLALELAAAQVRHHSVAEIAAALAEAPADLRADLRDLPVRHRHLHKVMAQSWELLTDAQRTALGRAAVFVGPFGRAAARAVLGADADYLAQLVDRSLVRRRMRSASQGSPLFELAPVLRAFLATQRPLADMDRDRHAQFYLAWAVNHPQTATNERANVAAAWAWVQSAQSVNPPDAWDPVWLDEARPEPVTQLNPIMGQPMPLVGRAEELARLRTALQPLTQEDRNAGLLVVSGPAGIGKSYLIEQLKRESTGVVWFDCPCDETNRHALYPIRHALGRYFGQAQGMPVAGDRAAFDARYADLLNATGDPTLRAELEEVRSFAAALVDIILPDSPYLRAQPAQRREQLNRAVRALVQAESVQQPLIVHLEDAHWLDAESHALLTALLRNAESFPFAIVATARPGGFDPPAVVDVPIHVVGLEPLGPADVADLAAAHLGRSPGQALVDLLLDRAGGNPFYTEQLLRYLQDSGLISGGELRSGAGGGLDVPLPLDVHNVLVSRLNRLGEDVRGVVAQASVLGREFLLSELQSLVGETSAVEAALQAGETEAIWHPASAGRYQFDHALLHNAAYDNQFDAQKQEAHRRAARVLSAQGEAGQPDYARIAHHWDEAGEAQRAVLYYVQAGDQARQNHFIREAHAFYSRGLALAEMDKDRLALLLGREEANHLLGNRAEQRADLRGLTLLAGDTGDKALLAEVALRQATLALATADYPQAIHHAQRATALAAAIPDQGLEAKAYHRWGRAIWQQGKGASAEPVMRRALRLAQAAAMPSVQAICLYDLAMLAYYANRYDPAREQIAQAYALFQAQEDKVNLIRCNDLLGNIAAAEGDVERAMGYYEASLGLCRTVNWPYGEAHVLARLGDCHFDLGEYDQCIALHREAISLSQALDDLGAQVVSLDTIGLAYQFQGAFDQARQAFTEALALHEAVNYPRGRAFVETHLGLLMADLEETEQAGIHLYSALAQRSDGGPQAAALDTEAALAWLDMARGDAEFAVERVREVVAWLAEHGTSGVELPLQVYWQCYAVMRMNGLADEAVVILAAAHDLLQRLAQNIGNDDRRQGFLANVPHHRQILQAWAAQTDGG